MTKSNLTATPVLNVKNTIACVYTIPMMSSMETIQFGTKNFQFALHSQRSTENISEWSRNVQHTSARLPCEVTKFIRHLMGVR